MKYRLHVAQGAVNVRTNKCELFIQYDKIEEVVISSDTTFDCIQ